MVDDDDAIVDVDDVEEKKGEIVVDTKQTIKQSSKLAADNQANNQVNKQTIKTSKQKQVVTRG